jgi:transposase
MLDATTAELTKVSERVARGRIKGKDKIGLCVGRVINKYKMAKHIRLDIGDEHFTFHINQETVVAEAALDGIYIVRTSVDDERMPADDVVRNYKKLSNVERAFRSLKTVDLKVRPVFHRLEERVRAHVFLCVLAYYVEWHMLEAWRTLLFCDDDQQAKATR